MDNKEIYYDDSDLTQWEATVEELFKREMAKSWFPQND